MAVFAREFHLNDNTDLKQVAQLDPTLQPDIDTIFAKPPAQ